MDSELLFKAFLGVEIISHAVRLMGKALALHLSSDAVSNGNRNTHNSAHNGDDIRKQLKPFGELVFEAAVCICYSIAFCIVVAHG